MNQTLGRGVRLGALLQMAQRAGTIRRVVRRGRHFICGLCRSHYDHPAEAGRCVSACWTEFLAGDPVVKRRADAWRCRFCARDHDSLASAKKCAAECKEKHLALRDLEVSETDDGSASDVGSGAPRPRPLRAAPRAVAMRAAPAFKLSKAAKAKRDEESVELGATSMAQVDPSEKATATAAAAMAADAAAESAKVEAEAAKPKKKKHDGSFYRDGARYVCSECNEKYFTRVEVQACFDKHKAQQAAS